MPLWLCLLLVAFFLAVNAFFVVAEFASVRVRKSQIDLAFEQGKPGARYAHKISENVNAYLAACQLGITIASLAIGWLGEPSFARLLRPLFDMLGLPEAIVVAICTALGFTLMTLLHVVLGEQVPKCLCLFNTEALALATAGPLYWFYRITYPIMVVFNAITNGSVRLLGFDPTKEQEAYTDDELKLLIDESTENGLLGEDQNEYVDNIFDLNDRDAESIMTPRTDLVCLDMQKSMEENRALMAQYKYTRYPVCRGNKDRIIGFVHIKDLYTLDADATMDDLTIRPIQAVAQSLSLPKLLQVLQDGHSKIAVVVDEHGGTAGIVTMSDVVEQILGRIHDEYQHEGEEVKVVGEGAWEIEGSLPLLDLEDLIGFMPDEANECETVGGLVMAVLDRIPSEGDVAVLAKKDTKVILTVTHMSGHRVDSLDLRVEKIDPEDEKTEK